MIELKGANVVITGASSGIGRAAALEFSRRANLLEEVAAECCKQGVKATVVPTDVNSRDQCQAMIAAAGRVDILVNNAGFAIFDAVEQTPPRDSAEMMATNYFGAFHCTQAVLPQMLERGRGSIVIVASIAGLMGYARMSAYCASKFALVGFAESLRDEVIGRGVQVALVCPATTETEFFVTAERRKLPGASRLTPGMRPEKVARAICESARDGRYRRILPFTVAAYIRFKEISPRLAHALFRRVSFVLERK